MTEASIDEASNPLLGKLLAGKYVIEAFLGNGAMASVYRARQVALDKVVAIKIMHPELKANASFVARFHREAKAASRLDHANSIRVMDFGEADGLLYIAMEYADGRDLFTVVTEEQLTNERIVDILSQALAALAVAHDMGVLHRDLKPENVMVLPGTSDEGQRIDIVKVCDFGIAKIMESEEPAPEGRKLSGLGVVVGTPHYMSPEQARGDDLDNRSDLYAVGVMLYHLLTGRTPFDGSPVRVMLKQISEAPPPPSALRRDVHRGLEAVCVKAMQKEPRDRYASAREMRTALRDALDPARSSHRIRVTSWSTDPGARTVVAHTPERRRARAPLVWLGAAVLVAVAFLGVRAARRPASPVELASTARASRAPPTMSNAELASAAVSAAAAAPSAASVPEPRAAPVAAPAVARADLARDERRPQRVARMSPAPEGPRPMAVTAPSADVPGATASAPLAAVAVSAPSASPSAATSSPPAAATPAPPAPTPIAARPAYDPRAAQVAIGMAPDPIGATSANVAKVVGPLAPRLTACYRDALVRAGTEVGGNATLHLETNEDGVIIDARYAGPLRDGIGTCVVQAVRGHRIPNVDTGTASADVPLTLRSR